VVSQEDLIRILGEWGLNLSFIVPFLFPFVVRTYWDWTKSSWGWNIISLELAISLAVLRSFIIVDFHVTRGSEWFDWLTVASLWAIPVIVVWRAYIIWHRQRHIANPEKENGKDHEDDN
jgi:hypothetical protein